MVPDELLEFGRGRIAPCDPNLVRHHHFEICDLGFDRHLLQFAGTFVRACEELQQVLAR